MIHGKNPSSAICEANTNTDMRVMFGRKGVTKPFWKTFQINVFGHIGPSKAVIEHFSNRQWLAINLVQKSIFTETLPEHNW